MSMIINAPTAKVATYNVAGQTDVQFNFDFDPTAMRADGTTLIVEYEGSEIRLENFFDADGNSLVENFLTQDGQAFSAAEFLAAIMGTEGGNTAEDIETAAGAAAGGSGAGDYSDDAGNLYDGLDALGGQGDAYDRTEVERLDEVPGTTLPGGGEEVVEDGIWWWMDEPGGGTYSELRQYQGSAESTTEDFANLVGQTRFFNEHIGTSGEDTLVLGDDDLVTIDITPDGIVPLTPNGDALLLEDDLSFPDDPGQPRVADIEVIHAGGGDDVIDLSSATHSYGDVTVYGEDGDDVLWTNSGDDTIYGGNGDDNIIGGLGNDVLNGGAGVDIIKGLEDNDILNGGEDSDKLFGGSGNDTINAGTGEHDVVVLGAGEDTLVIDADSLTAGADADPFGSGSTVEVLDFGNEDSFDFGAYSVLETRVDDFSNDGTNDLAIHVGDSPTGNNTWIVLDDTSLGDLSADMQQYLVDHLYIP